jgi:predicted metal-dependent phosphoesterase TrpH
LIDEAVRIGVHLLGISDHDTFAGYVAAVALARQASLELVCAASSFLPNCTVVPSTCRGIS